MTRSEALAKLKALEDELRIRGVDSLSLFGSTARGEHRLGSDIDIAVRLTDQFTTGGFDYFSRLEDLEALLSERLGCRVDVVEEPAHHQRLQREIDRDRALAF